MPNLRNCGVSGEIKLEFVKVETALFWRRCCRFCM